MVEKIIMTIVCTNFVLTGFAQTPKMYFSDSTDTGIPLAKDPVVIKFGGYYWMYYSRKANNDLNHGMLGWNIGIAQSNDLYHWKKTGEIKPEADYEKKGICAPGAVVKNGVVHLFYQTYGNGPKDAICHASSTDGLHFVRDISNPIFHPSGSWTNGRAINAEVYPFGNQYFLYFATRDTSSTIQKQGVAVAPLSGDFSRLTWKQAVDSSILKPALAWEGACIEGASIIKRANKVYMFYAGNYNNAPQQIGVAVSTNGITWKRCRDEPFLPNGKPGSWNSSESGHPCIFEDGNGKTYLFYQGNNDNGRTWHLSNVQIGWDKNGPYLIKD